MPWDIKKMEGQYCVFKTPDNSMVSCHKTRGQAVDHLRALYASETNKQTSQSQINFDLGEIEEAIYHLHLALDSTNPEEMIGHIKEALDSLGDIEEGDEDEGEHEMPMEHPMEPEYSSTEVKYNLEEPALNMDEDPEEYHMKEYCWEGPIVFEGVATGDNRYFRDGAITWDETTLPWAFRWQKASTQGHGGAVPIGRLDSIERKPGGVIYGKGVIIPELNEEAAEYFRLMEAGVASGVSVDGDSAEFEVIEEETGKPRIEFSSMRLRSLTAVDIPAFDNARISMVEAKEELARKKKKKSMMKKVWAYSNQENHQPLTAAAIPVKPPIEWFQDPDFDEPTPISVTNDGKVYGHLALFDTCHIGLPGCVKPPRNSKYQYFHTGEIETDQGDLVEVGHLTFNTGHAAMSDNAAAAAAHYDHTGTVAADVRCGEDKHGIWVSGALRPSLSDEEIRTFRAAPLSGDWRRIAGKLELVGALAVNVPGFPVPRTRVLVAGGQTETLITFSEEEIQMRYATKIELAKNLKKFLDSDDGGEKVPDEPLPASDLLAVPSQKDIKAIAESMTEADIKETLKMIKNDLLDDEESGLTKKERTQLEQLIDLFVAPKGSTEASLMDAEEFYNTCHDKSGKFCPTASRGRGGGGGGGGGGRRRGGGGGRGGGGRNRGAEEGLKSKAVDSFRSYRKSRRWAAGWAGAAALAWGVRNVPQIANVILPTVSAVSPLLASPVAIGGLFVLAAVKTQRHIRDANNHNKDFNRTIDRINKGEREARQHEIISRENRQRTYSDEDGETFESSDDIIVEDEFDFEYEV